MLYAVIGILAAAVLLCIVKICIMKKTAREISSGFAEKLHDDTNTRIDITSSDKDMKELAASLNTQLRKLREEYLRYHQGNRELINAITNISHDLRTPLTTIYGYLDMIKKTDDPQKIREYLDIITERTELMKQLTEELFRYSVMISDEGGMTTEEVFVNQLLEQSIADFYPALSQRNIQPQVNITHKKIVRQLNKAALSRVFANILNNAAKYSDGDLEVTLSDTGRITFANTAGHLSAVSVEQLFDRFYTVEAAHHSTGLGLAIAKTLIESMGAVITAELKDQRLIITIEL